MLQQAAVNLARSELVGREGVVAVNGPPGTGKTTLLRDLVAANVVDRALAMAEFGDPEQAFVASGQKMAAGDKAFFNFYRLHPSLRGHEMVVASSNNKAVENVSRELPASKAIGMDGLTFFKSISDNLHAPPEGDDDDEETGDGVETWGMIAAVLGNAKNRAAFAKRFWWDDDRGFRVYLKAAKGDAVVKERTDPATGRVERTLPAVVAAEAPPSPAQAKANWQRARTRLRELDVEIRVEMAALESVRQKCVERDARLVEVARLATARERADQAHLEAEARRHAEAAETERSAADLSTRDAEVAASRKGRPGLFARLFGSGRFVEWRERHHPLVAAAEEASRAHRLQQERLDAVTAEVAGCKEEEASTERRLTAARREVDRLGAEIDVARQRLGDRVVDGDFFARDHGSRHLTAPWIPADLHRKREELFATALAVHRAFIDAAAAKMMHNLGALMNVLSAGTPADPEKASLVGDLWSTLFIAVPLVSTTFASVERMFGGLSPGSIGWLLVDEAGQAVPQSAVGAIMRSKRTVVVGDPLQIPPVVTLPERLSHRICEFFRVDAARWAAPEASVQTLADATSTYQSAFRSDRGPRRVGIPLLVHRRCQEPMFGISNRIAYDGQMVHAVAPSPDGAIAMALGRSRWLDIDGHADTKWCPAEGDLVVSLLHGLAAAGIRDPDVFLISPFRVVAHELRRRLQAERDLAASLGIDVRQWVYDRVGTIHTVQGREAEGVILVLGAPAAPQNRARAWAAESPNILNVAVSRAKESLYVVGSYAAWSGIGYARPLSAMPRERCSAM